MREACRDVVRGVILLLLAVALAGCSAFRDRGFDYLQAKPGKPLEYPEGLRPIPSQELYPVPELAPPAPAAADAAVTGAAVTDAADSDVVPAAKPKKKKKKKKKNKLEIPEPPQLVKVETGDGVPGTQHAQALTAEQVVSTRDGNGYPVLMLDTSFDWAWQWVGDALHKQAGVKVEDLDRGRAVYYVLLDGKGNSAGDPWQLKLNYTANGVQVALQVDEQAMAPADMAEPLMKNLQEGLLP